MAIPLRYRETRYATCIVGAADGPGRCVNELILEKFKTVRPGSDPGLMIRVCAELRWRRVEIVGALWLLDSVLVSDVKVDVVVVRVERSFHQAFNARLAQVVRYRCKIP